AVLFLNLTAFIALMLGAIGIGIAVRQYIQQRWYVITTMRILGARSTQIGLVFLLEMVLLSLGAFAVGIPLGGVIRSGIVSVLARFVPVLSHWTIDFSHVMEGVCAGLLVAAPALAQPALVVRRIRPSSALRLGWERLDIPAGLPIRNFIMISAAVAFGG